MAHNQKVDVFKKVELARAQDRPTSQDYINTLFTDFVEFAGDRRYSDDKAVIAGIGRIKNMPLTVVAMEKGKTTKERVERNFGLMHPEGYRKALRQMKLAEKFKRPILCIVDTPGAYPGIEAEERGQGQAIAENLMEMMTLKTPIISIFIGEGGSGGALALAVADKVYMLENSIYSVISPEGCASILWKDVGKKKEAAECLKLTAEDLYNLEVIEGVINEPANVKNFKSVYAKIEELVYDEFQELKNLSEEELLNQRYQRFRKIGN